MGYRVNLKTDENKLITVCDSCFQASCLQGIFYCDNAKYAGTTEKTIKELKELNIEHECYWEEED